MHPLAELLPPELLQHDGKRASALRIAARIVGWILWRAIRETFHALAIALWFAIIVLCRFGALCLAATVLAPLWLGSFGMPRSVGKGGGSRGKGGED